MGTSTRTPKPATMRARSRRYETTHPWITFKADLSRVNYRLWMNLGEIQSKCEHVANIMLPPDVSKDLLQVYLAKGVRATTAIEGNTLSEEQVLARIRGKGKLPKSKEYLGIETDNIIEACNWIQRLIVESGDPDEAKLSYKRICDFNKMVLKDLHLSEGVVPGEVSKQPVGVASYRGAPRSECKHLLERLCEWINDEITSPSEEHEIAFGVIRAVLAHLYLAWIHPFGDGNGRTARLMELQLLLAANAPNVASHLLSNHYNQTRAEYYRQLDYAGKSGGDVIPFLEYAMQGMIDGLTEAIERIRNHQFEVSWRDYVYQMFQGKPGAAAERRRQIALDLWTHGSKGAPISMVRNLSPKVSALYASKTDKTVSRDLNELQRIGLIQRDTRIVRANRNILFAFLPSRLRMDD